MNNDTVSLIWGVVMIGVLVSALFSRRLSLGMLARGVIGWAAIGLVAYFVVVHRYELGQMVGRVTASLGLDEQQVDGQIVRIRMSPDGHFWARVKVNGVEQRMLIDSGATITALSDETAAKLGIEASDGGFPVMLETANGTIQARRGRIGELSIGGLVTRDLGVVIAPNFGDTDVLGMNFLSRLASWRVEGNMLVLDPGGGDDADGSDTPRRRASDSKQVTDSHRHALEDDGHTGATAPPISI